MKAVCLRCGEFKAGAWKRCPKCLSRPVGDEEKAKNLLLSSHFNNEQTLQEFSDFIKDPDKQIDFKDKDLEIATRILKEKQKNKRAERIHILKLIGTFLLTVFFMLFYWFIQTN